MPWTKRLFRLTLLCLYWLAPPTPVWGQTLDGTHDLKRAIDSSRATRSPPRAADTGSCIKPTKTFLEAKCVAVYRARTAQTTNH